MKIPSCFKWRYPISVARLAVLLALILMLLPGCLVSDKKSSKTINRSTDRLRTIVGNEYYQYAISGQRNIGGLIQAVSGTLTVRYSNDTLQAPLSTSNLSVIKEISTLTVNGASQTIIRWIQQDPITGSLSVVAINLSSSNYYVGQSDAWDTPHAVEFLPSQVPQTGNYSIDFQYFEGCDSGKTACSAADPTKTTVVNMTEDITFKGSAEIQTNIAKFNAIKYNFAGSTTLAKIAGPFDFRGACSVKDGDYSGSSYIFPEVGTVLLDYTCTAADGSGIVDSLRVNLTSTNVYIPKP